MTKIDLKPSILMIAPVSYPPAQPEAYVNAKLALAMKEAGWHVDIVAEALPSFQWYPYLREAWSPLDKSVHVVSSMPRTLKNALFCAWRSSLAAWNIFWTVPAFECIKKLVGRTRYDVILSRSLPDYAHLPAMMTHQRTGIPWIVNWNDPAPYWKKFPPPYGQGPQAKMGLREYLFYKKIITYCSWYTFPCERLRQYMISYLPEISKKTSVIPHIALDSHCRPPVPHKGFSLCYAGSLRPPRDPGVLLEGLRRFVHRRNDLNSLTLHFFAAPTNRIIELSKEYGLEKFIRIENMQPYEKMLDLLPAVDVLVVIEAPVDNGIFLPSKFIDYVQAGRPILALSPVVGTLNDILTHHGGGLAVDGQSPDAVANAIDILYSHWINGTLNDKYSSHHLLPFFNQKTVIENYLNLFEHLSVPIN